MRLAGVFLLLAVPAAADTFGGFSGVDRPYLVNQDRVCKPIKVEGGAAKGAPACEKAGADVIARLSIKEPIVQRGTKATFAATASGRTLTVSRKAGDKVVAWDSIDPIGKVVEVYASQYDDRVAVAYTVRAMGQEMTNIIAFDLLDKAPQPTTNGGGNPTQPPPQNPNTQPTPVVDPKLAKAIADANAAPKAKQMAAWKAVLAIDDKNSEALYHVALLDVAAKQTADALAQLAVLAASQRADAIEFLVEARFDPAFAGVRADPKFRSAVGLDRKGTTAYERLMGFGGKWEQTATSCDKPEVKLELKRDRNFKIHVKTSCQGQIIEDGFKGKWRIDGTGIVLGLPNKGTVSAQDEAPCVFEPSSDEDAMRCTLGKDLEFVVLPTRR